MLQRHFGVTIRLWLCPVIVVVGFDSCVCVLLLRVVGAGVEVYDMFHNLLLILFSVNFGLSLS